jgi:hypothetical protein
LKATPNDRSTHQLSIDLASLTALAALSTVILCADVTGATSPTPPAEVADVPLTENASVPDGLVVNINSDTVTGIRVESTILAPDEVVVSDPPPVEIAVLSAAEAVAAASTAEDVVVARSGDTVEFATSHAISLAPGLYSELIRLTVTDADYDVPVVKISSRFMEVTKSGIRGLSSTEFTDLVEPVVAAFDKNGKPTIEYVGRLGAPIDITKEPAGFNVPVELPSDPTFRSTLPTR